MAIAYDTVSTSAGGTGSSFSWSHTCSGTDRLLSVGIAITNSTTATISSVTYNGVALTQVRRHVGSLGNGIVEQWRLIAPATGSNTISVTFSGSVSHGGAAVSLTGVDQTNPVDVSNGANGSSTTPSVSLTTTRGNQMVVDYVRFANTSQTGTAGADQTKRADLTIGSSSSKLFVSTEPPIDAGSKTMSWTAGFTSIWETAAVAYNGAGVAFVSQSSTTVATRTNTTITAPSGIANNDVLLIISLIEDDRAPTPPAGFTQLVNIDHASHPMDLWVWWKIASSESGNYTITHLSNFCQSWMGVYRGADTTTPMNPTPSTNTGMTNATMTANGVTTARDYSAVVYAAGTWDDTPGSTPPTGTTPTFIERFDPAGTNVLYIADGVLATAGATGNKTVTGPSSNGWMTTLIGIQPPGTGISNKQYLGFF